MLQAAGAEACWVGAVAWELAWWGEGETQSGGETAGGSAIHHGAECREAWEWWAERAAPMTRSGPGGLEEAAGAGGSGRGLGCLCWGCVGG